MEQKRSSLRNQTFEELEMVAIQTFQQVINEEITRWREKNQVDNACAPVCEKVLRSFRMLEKNIEKGLVSYCNKPSSERSSVIYMRSSQIDNRNDNQTVSRTCTENATREDGSFTSNMKTGTVPVEIYNRQNYASEESRLHKDGSICVSSAQVPITADEHRSNGTENIEEEDTKLLTTDTTSLRSAQVNVTGEELETPGTENSEGEATQFFTNSKYFLKIF